MAPTIRRKPPPPPPRRTSYPPPPPPRSSSGHTRPIDQSNNQPTLKRKNGIATVPAVPAAVAPEQNSNSGRVAFPPPPRRKQPPSRLHQRQHAKGSRASVANSVEVPDRSKIDRNRSRTREKMWIQSCFHKFSSCNITTSYINQQFQFNWKSWLLRILLSLLAITSLLQTYAVLLEKQGPLDHVTHTMLWKPYYGRNCPAFSVPDDGNDLYNGKRLDGNFTPQLEDEVSWNCASTTNVTENNVKFPQIVLIGARGIDENNTFPMWKDTVLKSVTEHFVGDKISPKMPRLQRINTLKVSNQYAMSGGVLRQSSNTQAEIETTLPQLEQSSAFLCRGSMKWEQRLFAVYQSIFARLLSTYPDEQDFIIVEDDSVLVNPYAFVEEVCHARSNQMQFYSLYRSPLQRGISSVSCIYQHGTVAFYIRRYLMEKIMKERRRGWFCRFPIDMYISKLGPWYATRREVVGHLDGGRVGSKSE